MSDAAELAALKQDIIRAINAKAWYEAKIGVKLKIQADGWSEHVLCPIHGDSGKPNLSININSSGFRCFACGEAGNIFDFKSLSEGKDKKTNFRTALIELATEAGINIEEWKKGVRGGSNTSGATVKSSAAKPVDVKSTPEPKAYIPSNRKAADKDESTPPIPKKTVKDYQAALTPEHYKYLLYERGFTDPTIIRYQLGWNSKWKYKTTEGEWKSGRLTFPIINKAGEIRNIRGYSSDAPKENKMVNTKGYGSPPRLFNHFEIVQRKPTHLIYTEGEFKAMKTNQELDAAGFTSWLTTSNTAGCNTFEPEWLEEFEGKHVYIIFDVDPPGKQWSSAIATKFLVPLLSSGKLKELKIITLPLDGSKEYKDLTDYFVKTQATIHDLMALIESTKPITIESTQKTFGEATVEAGEIDSLITCMMDRQYIDQHITVPITVSGESTKLYHATKSFRVEHCPEMASDNCCSADQSIGLVPVGDTLFIESCMATKKQLACALQNIACPRGKPCMVEEIEKVVMQEYFAHQVIRRLTAEEGEDGKLVNTQQLLTVPIYVIQPDRHDEIGPGDYKITGYVRSHPQTRQATILVEHLESMAEDWSKFEINEITIQNLKAIQSFKNVKELLDELTTGVTQIYESDEILLTVLLTYLSPLRIAFNGQAMAGWVNSCIIGDTGTGKSRTYQRISDWIGAGDLFSALSGSRTGLLYAMKQKGVEWYVQIGRYVMANGKIIAIDETQEMEPDELKKMAIAMKEGWLEVSQVASGGYRTQTRAIFMMNPKEGKKISDFSYGCQALGECFDPMFIRRLDLAIFTMGSEDHSFYNKQFDPIKAASIRLKPEDLRALVYWAWTRTIHDVSFPEDSTKECLDKAVELSKLFGHADDIPLVCPQDFRENLARLSTSFAILSGSFSDDYEKVIVLPKHVQKMAKFIEACYSSASCNLKQYSRNSEKKKSLQDYENITENFSKIIERARLSQDQRHSEGQHFLQLILLLQQQSYIRKRDLCDQLGVTINWVQKHIAILQMHSLVEITKGGYNTTRKFNQFLRKWQEVEENAAMLESVYDKLGKLAMSVETDPDFGAGYQHNYSDPFSTEGGY